MPTRCRARGDDRLDRVSPVGWSQLPQPTPNLFSVNYFLSINREERHHHDTITIAPQNRRRVAVRGKRMRIVMKRRITHFETQTFTDGSNTYHAGCYQQLLGDRRLSGRRYCRLLENASFPVRVLREVLHFHRMVKPRQLDKDVATHVIFVALLLRHRLDFLVADRSQERVVLVLRQVVRKGNLLLL
jgi:hypothetical protein